MQFSHQWLGRYTELPGSTRDTAELLTRCGLVVEGAAEVAGDTAFDLDVPGNRVDLMNHLGVAREIATARRSELQPPEVALDERAPAAAELTGIDVEDRSGCPRFVARVVRDVRVGPSPGWMTALLEAIGLRPINNVVDITNFVMWELGHPLHAYDLSLLEGRRLIVRSARAGETLVTLDGVERRLTAEDIVIADERRAVGLAGVMGGLDTEIRASTSDVLLEGAWWDPLRVRRTSQRLDLQTDASYRFQRAPAFDGMIAALDRAAALTAELSGGAVQEGRIDVVEPRPAPPEVALRSARLARLLGVEVEEREIEDILERLGFGIRSVDGAFSVSVPTFRNDVRREEDLIEEVARHFGYERLPDTLPALPAPRRVAGDDVLGERRLKDLCVAAGYFEAMSSPLSGADEQAPFLAPGSEPLRVANPISEGLAVLRAHLVPGLLAAVAHNLNRGTATLRLFEVGHRFAPPAGDGAGAEERATLALAAVGPRHAEHWTGAARELDLYELKGAIETITERMGWPAWVWEPAALPGLMPGSSARLTGGDTESTGAPGPTPGNAASTAAGAARGWAGRLDEATARRLGIEAPVWVAELDIEDLLRLPSAAPRYRPLPRFPGGSRDLSVLLDEEIAYADVVRALQEVAERLRLPLEELSLIDVYRGDDIPEGGRSLTLRFSFRADDRTLTAEEIDAAQERLTEALIEQFSAERR